MDRLDERKNHPIPENMRERIVCWVVLSLMILTFWYMIDIALITFIITFIFYNLLNIIQKRCRKLLPFQMPDGFVLVILYLVFVGILITISYDIFPKLVTQVLEIAQIFKNFDVSAFEAMFDERITAAFAYIDFKSYLTDAGTMMAQWVGTVSVLGLNFVLSLLLSFFLILEKDKIKKFSEKLSESSISFIYSYLLYFGGSFAKTFGKVMKVQVTIACINSVVSMILLSIMGFPQILGLGVMIFVLGLIPVAGVVVSLLPLCLIAFNVGGITKVLWVIAMIIVIHAVEAYILNPKLMSSKTKLPVCFVFIILLVGEHYLHVWGLLIGVPIFIFLMDVFGVNHAED